MRTCELGGIAGRHFLVKSRGAYVSDQGFFPCVLCGSRILRLHDGGDDYLSFLNPC